MAKEEKIKDEMEQIEKKEHDEEDENEEEDIDENQTENENKDDDNSDFEDYSLEKKRDNLKDGDYIVQVHIIEGRELKGRGWNAMSDPVISVECMNQKQSTEIKKNCINAMYVIYFYRNNK